jgi:hypothetical protein
VHNTFLTWGEVFQKWIPLAVSPIFAGTFLALLVPWANHIYWKRRIQNERRWHDERFKREMISDIAELLEGAFLNIDRLAELEAQEPNITNALFVEHHKEKYLINRAKLEAEKGIGKMARLIEVHYSDKVMTKMKEWINEYNDARDTHRHFTPDDPLVFKAVEVLKEMRTELDLVCHSIAGNL